MKTLFIDEKIKYTGKELSPHFILKKFNVYGDALISFYGEANVELEDMVDLEDVIKQEKIYSPLMLHFIGEFFSFSLFETVLLQRLLINIVKDNLEKSCPLKLNRLGDDLFFEDDKKLTVSIATRSVISTLIHLGINIETKGTPVKTVGLDDFNLDFKRFAQLVLYDFQNEIDEIVIAKSKVRAV